MSIWKSKLEEKLRPAKLPAFDGINAGANRRAISLLPVPTEEDSHYISDTHSIKYRQLLLVMEGKQSNACLRIFSEREKTRSAILIYRGRVFGCIHGDKQSGQQRFGVQAYRKALAQLASPNNLMDTYLLTNELVLAAGSLFHGRHLTTSGTTGVERFSCATETLLKSKLPGCVVISSNFSNTVCLVYVFFNQIIGVYSFRDGWVEPTYESALHYVEFTHGCRISATALAARNRQEARNLTFSLSGLDADRVAGNEIGLHGCDAPTTPQETFSRCRKAKKSSVFVGSKR